MPIGKILSIEDDKNISKLIKYNLEKNDFVCYAAASGEEGLRILDKEKIDLVILDIMLPKMDGLSVCKEIRKNDRFSKLPIIMLTAKGEEVDRVLGFELGADDYVVKPFSPRELILRIKAILKRRKSDDKDISGIIFAENIAIDTVRHKVTVRNKEIQLTLMEFKLLSTLIKRRGRVQSREALLDDVWDIESDVTTRTIDTHIKRIREKLGKSGDLIETIRGIGYKFHEEE